jgi:hypothetical protein
VGISNVYLNSSGSSDGGSAMFKNLYYYTGSFEREKAGSMAEYQSDNGGWEGMKLSLKKQF